MSEDVLFIRAVQHWFNRFKRGNLKLDDLPRFVRLLELDVDLLKQLIDEDRPRLTSRHLVEQLGSSHTAMEKHLNELGKTWRYGVRMSPQLSPHQPQYRADVCMNLIISNCNY